MRNSAAVGTEGTQTSNIMKNCESLTRATPALIRVAGEIHSHNRNHHGVNEVEHGELGGGGAQGRAVLYSALQWCDVEEQHGDLHTPDSMHHSGTYTLTRDIYTGSSVRPNAVL